MVNTHCTYCNGPLDGGERWVHGVCGAESGRRYDAGKCIACGERDAGGSELACRECLTSNAPYRGYPPEAA